VYGVGPHLQRDTTERATLNRRRLLRAAATGPLVIAFATGCTTETAGKSVPLRQPDSDSHVRWRTARAEQELLALYAATLETHPDLADRLNPLAEHHEKHLAAVLNDGPLPIAAAGMADPAPDEISSEEGGALKAIREAEDAMSELHAAGSLAASGGLLAALLASIAASEAAHTTTLGT
jgi:hypothetical protein